MNTFGFWRDPLFLVGSAAYALNRWLMKPHIHSAFLHSYFNDLWLIPCALPLVLYLHWRLGLRPQTPPSFLEVFAHVALWSALFEWWGPHFWTRATGDVRDVFCYAIGGLIGWAWWNRSQVASLFARRE